MRIDESFSTVFFIIYCKDIVFTVMYASKAEFTVIAYCRLFIIKRNVSSRTYPCAYPAVAAVIADNDMEFTGHCGFQNLFYERHIGEHLFGESEILFHFYILLHKNNRKYLNNSLNKYDLNLIQSMCLLTIHQKDNTTQQDLSEYLFLTKSGVTNAIRNLEKNNYITRTQSKKDGRQYTIKLTQKGEKIIPTLIEINQKWENTLELNKLDQRFLDDLTELANKSINLNL